MISDNAINIPFFINAINKNKKNESRNIIKEKEKIKFNMTRKKKRVMEMGENPVNT